MHVAAIYVKNPGLLPGIEASIPSTQVTIAPEEKYGSFIS